MKGDYHMLLAKQCISAIGIFTFIAAVWLPISACAKNPFQAMDRDRDGRLSRQEFAGSPTVFEAIDNNSDDYLTPLEMRKSREQQNMLPSSRRRFESRRQAQKPLSDNKMLTSKERTGPFRFIDTHMHLHPVGLDTAMAGGRRKIDSSGRVSKTANLAAAAVNLISRMDQQRLSQALVVVVPSAKESPEDSWRNMHTAVRQYPDRLHLLAGGAILGSMLKETKPENVTDEIKERFRKEAEKLLSEGAVGFGEMISYHLCMTQRHSFKYTPPNHPLFLLLADIAAENDVPIDIHMEAIKKASAMPERLRKACGQNPETLMPTIPDFEMLLRHNRKARIVWQHIGWDNTGQMQPALLRELLNDHPNLYLSMRIPSKGVDNSGNPIPNRITDPDMKIMPEWKKLIEDFSDRVMLGADEFIGPGEEKTTLAASFETTWALVDQLPGKLSAKIGWENARRVYHLQ